MGVAEVDVDVIVDGDVFPVEHLRALVQVSDRRSESGRVLIFAVKASRTCPGLYPSGRCSSIT